MKTRIKTILKGTYVFFSLAFLGNYLISLSLASTEMKNFFTVFVVDFLMLLPIMMVFYYYVIYKMFQTETNKDKLALIGVVIFLTLGVGLNLSLQIIYACNPYSVIESCQGLLELTYVSSVRFTEIVIPLMTLITPCVAFIYYLRRNKNKQISK